MTNGTSALLNDNAELELLTQAWQRAKADEEAANARRIAIESDIYQLVEDSLPDKGTTTLETGMKIVTGFTESWDQEKIADVQESLWPSDAPFPFKREWKPDGRAISSLRDYQPRLYQLIADCLTLKPRKPSFSVKSE